MIKMSFEYRLKNIIDIKQQMFDSKFSSQRYQQAHHAPNNSFYNQMGEQKIIPLSSASHVTRVRIVKPIRHTDGVHINYNLPKNHKRDEIGDGKLKIKLHEERIEENSTKVDQIQDNNRRTYQQWLNHNSIKVGIKKNIRQRQQKSLNIRNSQEKLVHNEYSSLKNKVQSINKGIKASIHLQNCKINNILSINPSNTSINNLKRIVQNNPSRFKQSSPMNQKQKSNDQINNMSQHLQEDVPNYRAYFRKDNSSQMKRIPKNIYVNSFNANKVNLRQINSYSAFEGHFSAPIQKQFDNKELKQTFYPIILNKSTVKNQPFLYFAQTYKGRRPYNQDRYVCHNKNESNTQKLERFSGKVQNFTRHTEIINGNSEELQIKFKQSQKQREYLFGVFDGHGGSKCAEFVKQNFYSILYSNKNLFISPEQALKQTFSKIEEKFISMCQKKGNLETSGSCAVVAFFKNNKLYIGNVGDSRAILLNEKQVIQVTKDHKPEEKDQKMRIIRYGGKLYKDGSVMGIEGKQNIKIFNQTRIMPGSLNVSRTIGDIEVKLKKYGGLPGIVIAQPDIYVENVGKYEYLILASDGLFQGLQNKQIHEIYQKMIKNKQNSHLFHPENPCKTLTNQLIRRSGQKSNDNITIICVKLCQNQIQQIC